MTADLYFEAMEVKVTQDKIQQVTQQNAKLMTLVHEQQKKIEELMNTSKNLIKKMTGSPKKWK